MDCHFSLASAVRWCYLDVYLDGVLWEHIGVDGVSEWPTSLRLILPTGHKRITLVLPCLFSTRIRNVRFDPGTALVPMVSSHTLLFLGDSITQGYTARYPSMTYANIVGRRLDARILNQGIGGGVFDVHTLDAELDYKPDQAIIAYGTNDWINHRDLADRVQHYMQVATEIFSEAAIYVLLPLWRADIEQRQKKAGVPFLYVHETIKEACMAYGSRIHILDGYRMLPHCSALLADEQVHPNDLGFVVLAEAVEKALRQQMAPKAQEGK